MDTIQEPKLKDLEKENLRLKRLVVDLSLDNAIMEEVLSKKDQPGQSQRGSRAVDGSAAGLRTTCLPGDQTAESNPTLS